RAPRGVDSVAMEAAADLIVDRAASHRIQGGDGDVARGVIAGLRPAQEKVDVERMRELRGGAETAVLAIVPFAQPLNERAADARRDGVERRRFLRTLAGGGEYHRAALHQRRAIGAPLLRDRTESLAERIAGQIGSAGDRSEERRVGKECRGRWGVSEWRKKACI